MTYTSYSVVSYFRRYKYIREFVEKYKPLRSGMETQFSRRKKYYETKYFNELRQFSESEIKHWKSIFYCRELKKLTEYYYCIDDLKNNKDFQLEINVELFTNLVKFSCTLYDYYNDLEDFQILFNYDIDINFHRGNESIFYLTLIILLSFLLEKDIRNVKNIECLKSVYYVVGLERTTLFSVYKMIDLIYENIIIDPCINNPNVHGACIQATPERIYENIHNFFKEADKIFINCFVDNLQYLEN